VIGEGPPGEAARYAQALGLALVTALVLVLVFLVGSFIIVRSSRRYRASLERRRARPTQSDDAWSLSGTRDADGGEVGEGEGRERT